MKRILILLVVVAIAGCAATTKTEVKRGKKRATYQLLWPDFFLGAVLHQRSQLLRHQRLQAHCQVRRQCGGGAWGLPVRPQPCRLHQSKHDRHL